MVIFKMNTRRGMGRGTGKIGYYNLAPMDSHIHSLSAKGVKQNYHITYNDKKGVQHNILWEGYFPITKFRQKGNKLISFEELNAKGLSCDKKLCQKVQELRKLDVPTSDLQGIITVLAQKIGKELQLVDKNVIGNYETYPDVEEELLSYAYGKQTLAETEKNIKNLAKVKSVYDDEVGYGLHRINAKGENVLIVKGVNGWRIENDKGKILVDKVFNNHLDAFDYYKQNLKLKSQTTEQSQTGMGYEINAKGMKSEIDKLEKRTKELIAEEERNHGYPENQKKALSKFFKLAREKTFKDSQELYNFWKEFDTFGVSITGRITGNRAFNDQYSREQTRKWYEPIYQSHVDSFNKSLGQLIKKTSMNAKGYTDAYIDYKKLKKGTKVKFRSRKGVLTSDAEYVSGGSWGGFQARIKWNDGEESEWSLNKTGMKFWGKLPSLPKNKGTESVYGIVYWNKSKGQRDLAGNDVWTTKKQAEKWIKAKTKDVWTASDYKNYKIKKFKVGKDAFQPVLGSWVYDRGRVYFARSQWQGD
jgi:hypothetical protein